MFVNINEVNINSFIFSIYFIFYVFNKKTNGAIYKCRRNV